MGVAVDTYIGYSVDIYDKFNNYSKVLMDKWLEDFKSSNKMEFDKLNFTPLYNTGYKIKDKVSLIYDGMSGTYCKLMYVLAYDYNTGDDISEDVIKSINSLLKESKIPEYVEENIKRVYSAIFSEELNTDNNNKISAEYLLHWH